MHNITSNKFPTPQPHSKFIKTFDSEQALINPVVI